MDLKTEIPKNIFCITWSKLEKIAHKDIILPICTSVKDYHIIDLNQPITFINHPQSQGLLAFLNEAKSRGNGYVMFYDDKSNSN